MVEGGRDRNLPPREHTQKLIAAKTSGEMKVLHIAGATHRSLCQACWPGLDEEVEGFCGRVD